ncbi:MAG: hypothetical protein KF773_09740 [Deltaproteobacteria bacterium]|nr:hypothetical protein [Deltaproteobacteria bacterium]
MATEPTKKPAEPTSNPTNPTNPTNPANPFAAFDVMTSFAASQQTFQKMMAESFGRAQAFADQYAAFEAQMVTRANTAVQGWAQLAQDAIAYSAQLSAEARRLTLDAARRFGAGA